MLLLVTLLPILNRLHVRRLRKRVASRRKTAIVYVDGFNLYRSALQGHPELKWLDLVSLCEKLLPSLQIKLVRFFTADIRALQGTDPTAPARQQAYLRVLEAHPRVAVHRGKFNVSKRLMDALPVTVGADGKRTQVKVRKIEEKQSDVSLGAWMVLDATRSEADVFVLLSSDSDFAGLLDLLGSELGCTLGLIVATEGVTADLRRSSPRYVRRIRSGALAASQFPDEVGVGRSKISRPTVWR